MDIDQRYPMHRCSVAMEMFDGCFMMVTGKCHSGKKVWPKENTKQTLKTLIHEDNPTTVVSCLLQKIIKSIFNICKEEVQVDA